LLGLMSSFLVSALRGQSLAPRAYVITPVGANAVTLTTNIHKGAIQFDSAVPITAASGTNFLAILSYYRSLNFFGRSANITVGVPYGRGTFQGLVVNQQQNISRSGLGNGEVRFSVNLKGGPTMNLAEFTQWKQKRLLGVSVIAQFPSGQYDPTRLINIGTNRWAFKPEVGYSEQWDKWVLDVYGAVWLFTTNPEFFSRNTYFPGTQQQTQEPIGAVEGHLSRDIKLGTWVSLDGNFWYGGRTSLNGVPNPNTLQRNSRVGATAALRVSKHQSVKISFSTGSYIRFGGNFQSLAVAWQYAWLGRFRK
jgi:hypothetical protein